jgi:hypothetical protein
MDRVKRSIVVAALAVSLTALSAVPAPASVDAKSVKKFCQLGLTITTDLTDPNVDVEAAASDLAKTFKKLVRLAPTKRIKHASTTISEFYADVAAHGKPDEDAISNDTRHAITVFVRFAGSKCLRYAVPTT